MVTVKTQIHVAINQLTFPIRDHRRVQQLKLVVALLDAAGNIVAAKEGTMDFAMSEATYTRLSAIGINAGLNLDAPPGAYHLRGVVQESSQQKNVQHHPTCRNAVTRVLIPAPEAID